MSTKTMSGNRSELIVSERVTSLGHRVSIPFGQYKYDIVCDIEDELYKVQVKTASVRKSEPNSVRCTLKSESGYTYHQYVDAFALYSPPTDEVYWLWSDEAPKTSINVSIRDKEDMRPSDLAKCRHRTDVLLENKISSS